MPEIVVFASEKGSGMDLDYYLNSHVPMVFKVWQPFAKSWKAEVPGPESSSPYEVMVFATLDNPGDFARALGNIPPETQQQIDADLKNCSAKPPKTWTQIPAL
jgi:hypothetical protein